jgi:hypothetical protein
MYPNFQTTWKKADQHLQMAFLKPAVLKVIKGEKNSTTIPTNCAPNI